MSSSKRLSGTALLEHLLTISQRLTEMRDLTELLRYAIDEVLQMVVAERGYIVLVSETGALDFRVQRKAGGSELTTKTDPISRSILDQVIQTSQSLIVTDAMTDPRFASADSVITMQLRSIMCVPLITQNRTIGAIYVENHTGAGRFSAKDLTSLEFFSNQTAGLIENANLYNNLEQLVEERTQELISAQRETETLYQITQTLAELNNQREMAEAVLPQYLGYLNFKQGGVVIFDEALEKGTLIAIMRNGNIVESGLEMLVVDNPAWGRMIKTKAPVIIADTLTDPILEPLRELVYELGQKSMLLVPIIVNHKLLGALGADAIKDIYEFTEQEINLMQNVADRLGIAFENQRLFEQTQQTIYQVEEQSKRLNLLNQLAIRLGQANDEQRASRIIARYIPDIFQCDRTSLALYQESDHQAEIIVLEGITGRIHTDTHISLTETGIGYVFNTREILRVPDMRNSRFTDFEALTKAGLLSCMIAPLWGAQGKVFGSLNVTSKRVNSYTLEHEQLMIQIAALFAASLENRSLVDQLQLGLAETERLYSASRRLNVATSLQEILQTISLIVDETNRAHAALCTFDLDEQGRPEWAELIAISTQPKKPFDARFYLPDFSATNLWIQDSDAPIFVSDFASDERVDAHSMKFFASIKTQALLVLPLKANKEWVGVIYITWTAPREFSAEDVRFIKTLMPQVGVLVSNQLLYHVAQQNEEELRLVFDYAPNAIVLFNIETKRFEYGNANARSLFGVKQESFLNVSPLQVSPQFQPNGQPSFEGFEQMIQAALRNDSSQFEWTYRNIDTDEAIPCEIHWITLPGERSHLVRGNISDLRERKETQAKLVSLLQENERQAVRLTILNDLMIGLSQVKTARAAFKLVANKTKQIIGTERVSVALLNDQGRLELFALDGVEGAMSLGISFATTDHIMLGAVLDRNEPILVRDTSQSDWIDVQELYKMGLQATLDVPLVSSGQVIGTLNTATSNADIYTENSTQLLLQIASLLATTLENRNLFEQAVQAKERAEIANHAKDAFLASMSHELRTPLNGILGYTQILKRDDNTTAKQQEGLDVIEKSGHHLLTLINDILDIAKIEARKLELELENVSFRALLNSVIGLMQLRAQEKELIFRYEIDPNLPLEIVADEKRLRQVLINLLGNAIKFTDQGEVKLQIFVVNSNADHQFTAKSEQSVTIRFEVIDTGVGIDETDLEKIFTPFEQVSASDRRNEGTGLGLTISQSLVEAMGSNLFVESALGQGSRFWFDLDMIKGTGDSLAKLNHEPGEIIGYRGETRYKILAIDDDAQTRSLFADLLTPLGFEVLTANDGEQGLTMAQSIYPDLIFVDLVMPILDGFEVIRQIRTLKIFQDKNLPIIAVSASAFDTDKQKSIAAGANLFLAKPFKFQKMIELLEKYLKIQWIQATENVLVPSLPTPYETFLNLASPPVEELQILFDLARRGNISRIRERAAYLETLDEQYTPFAKALNRLALEFDDDQILELVQAYLQASEDS